MGGVVRQRNRGFWLRLAGGILRPIMIVMTKREWRGHENVPATGPAILVSNHLSYADPLVMAHYVYDRPRHPRFLAKDSLFRLPLAGRLLYKVKQIPVRRNSTDAAAALSAAFGVLEEGETVIIYPEGTCTKDLDLWPMQGKTGAARLALATGVPVIPIAQWGAQRFHNPVTGKIRLWPRARVTVVAGPPVDLSEYAGKTLTSDVLRAATDTIMRRLRDDVAVIRGVPAPTGPLTSSVSRRSKS